MITNTITANEGIWPSRYLGEIPMITQNQKEKLTTLIYQNIPNENERELRLMELQDLTEADASYALFQFSQGIWG